MVSMGILILILSSCGDLFYRVETGRPAVPRRKATPYKRVVILPFADYTPHTLTYGYWRRDMLVKEGMKEGLTGTKLLPAHEEDVVPYLIQRGIIRETGAIQGVTPQTAQLQSELDGRWTPQMGRYETAVYQNMANNPALRKKDGEIQPCVPLDEEMIKEIGAAFGADYVIRGRIMEISFRQKKTYYPSQSGVLPFFFRLGQRMTFGEAEADAYERFDLMAPGGLMGMDIRDMDRPFKMGEIKVAPMVRLGMLIQDTGTGDIIWSVTADVTDISWVTFTNHAWYDWETVLADAIRNASKKLVGDLVNKAQKHTSRQLADHSEESEEILNFDE